MSMTRLAPVLVVSLLVLSCSALPATEGDSSTAAREPTPVPATVALDIPAAVDQALQVTYRGSVLRAGKPVTGKVVVDFGDGTGTNEGLLDGRGGFFGVHVFARPGAFPVTATVGTTDPAASATVVVTVRPRKLLFIQGMNSESRCPDGRRFLTRAPAWVGDGLSSGAGAYAFAIEASQFIYFSYTGSYCAGGTGADGAPPVYERSDTCDGVKLYAERLRALVDASAPAKVTIAAHSMGGVIAAYTIASDPDWARERIISVATFDSPLKGIDTLRVGALSIGSWLTDDCGATSRSVKDLKADAGIIDTVRKAGSEVPFFTLDATANESAGFGRVEAVPGDDTRMDGERLHVRISQGHSDAWGEAGDIRELDKRRFVICALLVAGPECMAR
jgi:pimeloyl-ACP methyl ester carboxylesterase